MEDNKLTLSQEGTIPGLCRTHTSVSKPRSYEPQHNSHLKIERGPLTRLKDRGSDMNRYQITLGEDPPIVAPSEALKPENTIIVNKGSLDFLKSVGEWPNVQIVLTESECLVFYI